MKKNLFERILQISFLTAMLNVPLLAFSQSGDYPTTVDKNQNYTRNDRRLNSVSLSGSADGSQTISLGGSSKVYTVVDSPAFTARVGETLTPSFGYSGTWMHGYVYLDCGQDGLFEAELGDNGSIPEGSDIMAFSYVESNGNGYNSNGEGVSNANVLNPPAFTLPADLPNGFYRMRFKVDWSWIDPAGRPEDGNGMLKNGGAICDVRLNVHGDDCDVKVVAENGAVLAADGSAIAAKHPFGESLTIKVVPAEGYMFDALRIRHGHNLDGDSLLHGVAQYGEQVLPAYLFSGESIEIPADCFDGEVLVEALFVKTIGEAANGYGVSFDKSTAISNEANRLKSLKFVATPGRTTTRTISSTLSTVYADLTPAELRAMPGSKVTATVSAAAEGLHYYLYIDYNNDGKFAATLNEDGLSTMSGELVAFTYYNGKNSVGESVDAASAGKVLPAFNVSSKLPTGIYRARLKADKNNADPAGSATIVEEGGMIVDFLLNVYNEQHSLKLYTLNGNIYDANNVAHPNEIAPFTSLKMMGVPVATGYVAEEMYVKHGHNLDGPQYVNGNRQWSIYSPSSHRFTIPTDSVNGDMEVTIHYTATENAEYSLVFCDEFNAADGSQPNSAVWVRCKRQSATWNRWLSNSEEVVYIDDNELVTRAIPNPDTATDDVPMITGGIWSRGLFGFTYGRIESRILTNPWKGNFPAFWLMPEDQSLGWPKDGEIDIFEAIDAQNRAWHTVHSNWTWNLGNKNNPKSSYDESVSLDRYHTYALEWDETSLVWFVDGVEVGRYEKSTDSNVLSQGQWPFNKHFHIILNQSVGNGSWAANADVTHTYETRFDWVRVYQKEGMKNTWGTVGISEVKDAAEEVEVDVVAGGVRLASTKCAKVAVYELSGRKAYEGVVDGTLEVALDRGFYLVNGVKVFVY